MITLKRHKLAPTPIILAPTVPIASLTAHNTSAAPAYNQSLVPAQFGTASYINNTTTTAIDPTKMDLSMNAVTPGHVSNTDVHTLIPSRPDLKWFVHLMAGWYGDGHPNNSDTTAAIISGYTGNSDAYVAALIPDLMRRGFDGVLADWNGINSPADQTCIRIKNWIAANAPGQFKYAILVDEGLIVGLTDYPATGAGSKYQRFTAAVTYLESTYFGDPNYEQEAGKAFLPTYGIGDTLGDAGTAAAKAAVGSTSSWGENGTGHINQAWCDVSYDWTDNWQNVAAPGYPGGDPYNLAALTNFYSTVGGVPAKKAMGAICGGFNGTISGSGWSRGKCLPQQANANLVGTGALVARANFVNINIPSNVTRMQWVTWNDYPEGSAAELGYENNCVLTASISGGSNLNWTTATSSGDETSIDHYEIYASSDGLNARDLGSVATPAANTFSLVGRGLTTGVGYTAMVVAVGKPCVRDHISNAIGFTGP